MVALKYDPFTAAWNLAATDLAYRDAEFQTHWVTNLLASK